MRGRHPPIAVGMDALRDPWIHPTAPKTFTYCQRGSVVLLFLFLNISFVFLNKFLFVHDIFVFPVLLTAVNLLCTFLGSLVLGLTCQKEQADWNWGKLQKAWKGLMAVGVCHGIAIAMTNMSLVYINIAANQVIRSTTPVLMLLFSKIVEQKHFSWGHYASVSLLMAGTVLAVLKDPEFSFFGVIICVLSTFFTAVQIVASAVVLQIHNLSVVVVTCLTSLMSCFFLFPLASMLEGPRLSAYANDDQDTATSNSSDGWNMPHGARAMWFAVGSTSLLAVLYNLTIFALVDRTSSLFSAIMGNIKVVLIICISIPLFHNKLSVEGAVGIVVTVVGFGWYSYVQYQKTEKEDLESRSGVDHVWKTDKDDEALLEHVEKRTLSKKE